MKVETAKCADPVEITEPSVLFLQVVMGYSHSLVIARQDTEQEQEKLKKLPEYNPRTIWSGLQRLNQRCSAGTPFHLGGVLVGWLSSGGGTHNSEGYPHISTTSKLALHQFGHSNQRKWDWRWTDPLDGPTLTMNSQDILTSHLEWTCNSLLRALHT